MTHSIGMPDDRLWTNSETGLHDRVCWLWRRWEGSTSFAVPHDLTPGCITDSVVRICASRRLSVTDKTKRASRNGARAAAIEAWSLAADGYVAEVLPMMEHFARAALQHAALPPGAHVVDVATGPGTLALLAARQGITVSALDFSPAMIANLERRAREAGLGLADVRIGDGQDLPFETDGFDGAFSMAGLVFFPDRAAGFRELRRVLRSGGPAVVSSMATLSHQLITALRCLGLSVPDVPTPPASRAGSPLADPGELAREMSEAGFRDVATYTVHYSETVPTTTAFWEKVHRGAAFIVQLHHQMGEERWIEVSERTLACLRDALGDGPIEERYTALLGVGLK
jgi:SAM-dependent methyltransferase